MTKKAEITPLPWKLTDTPIHVMDDMPATYEVLSESGDGYWIAQVLRSRRMDGGDGKANAAYIVRACNAYPAMLKALWKIYESVDIREIERIAGEAIQAAAGES